MRHFHAQLYIEYILEIKAGYISLKAIFAKSLNTQVISFHF